MKEVTGYITRLDQILGGIPGKIVEVEKQLVDEISQRRSETKQTQALQDALERLKDALGQRSRDIAQQRESQEKRLSVLEARTQALYVSHSKVSESLPDPRTLEREVLQNAWEVKHRQEAIRGFQAAAKAEQWASRFDVLRVALPAGLSTAPPLQEALRGIVAPIEQVALFQTKLGLIERTLTEPETGHSWSIFHFRDLALHLSLLIDTEEGRRLQKFRLEEWVREKFRGFADSFYRELWRRKMEGRWEELQDCEPLVAETLSWGQLEVIPIVPGETQFESRLHIGRSTTSNSDYPEGAIISVVRTGFREQKDRSVLQAPEVIVNRR